jgi:hypothetical protein
MSSDEADASLHWLKYDVKVKKGDETQRPTGRSGHTLTG